MLYVEDLFLGKNGGPVGFAHISVFDMLYDEKGELFIPIYYDFPSGIGDVLDKDSALVRPFNNILKIEDGRPNGKIAFVFYLQNGKHYVLGSFVHTIGKRILFFPGSKARRVTHTPDGTDLHSEVHIIDHITLENNLSKFHTTLIDDTHAYRSVGTRKLEDDIFLWCVMGVKSVEKLEQMPRTQEYKLKGVNNKDTKRRFKEFLDSTKGSDFHIVEVKSNPEPPYFLNFEVFISDQKINHSLLPKPLFVTPSPQLNPKKTVSRTVDVELGTFLGSIVIRSTKFSGCIKDDTVIFPGNHEDFDMSANKLKRLGTVNQFNL